MFRKIAIASAMGIELVSYDARTVELSAPLSLNSNDKGTFFAGSIYSTMVLSGWALVTRLLEDKGFYADVVIATSSIDYKKPAVCDVVAKAVLSREESLSSFITTIENKGRGKIDVESVLSSNGIISATFNGLYVARLR